MSKSSKNKKKSNEIIIKKNEIDDYVESFSSKKIGDIYYLIKEECSINSLPILDNLKYNSYGDFINIILDCVNTNQIFKDNNKVDV
jgi:hypothetical protein